MAKQRRASKVHTCSRDTPSQAHTHKHTHRDWAHTHTHPLHRLTIKLAARNNKLIEPQLPTRETSTSVSLSVSLYVSFSVSSSRQAHPVYT